MTQMEQLINSNSYHANIINNMNNNNHRIQSNVSVISHSSTSNVCVYFLYYWLCYIYVYVSFLYRIIWRHHIHLQVHPINIEH